MGTMRERSKGVWQLRVSGGVDPVDGRRLVVTETFRGSKRAAGQRLAELEVETRRGGVRTARTLRQTITAWRAQAGHAAGTARNYDLAVGTLPKHLLDTRVDKVTADAIRELYKRVEADHGIPRTRQVHAVISGALTYAWREGWITENPARRVQVPAQPARSKTTTPTPEHVAALVAVVADDLELTAWLTLSAMLGSRRSEELALHWSDIDLDAGQVRVTKALDPVAGGEKSTKTKNRRTVAIGATTVEVLRRWRVAFLERAMAVGAKPAADPYVFCRDIEGVIPWRPDLATKRFARCRKAAKIPTDIRLHDLRHFVATELLAAGVPLRAVSERLGHSRIATTADLYADALPATDRAAADLLEQRTLSS